MITISRIIMSYSKKARHFCESIQIIIEVKHVENNKKEAKGRFINACLPGPELR